MAVLKKTYQYHGDADTWLVSYSAREYQDDVLTFFGENHKQIPVDDWARYFFEDVVHKLVNLNYSNLVAN